MALYVRFMQEEKPQNIEEFLKLYYTKEVDPFCAKGHDTYKDDRFVNLQCTRTYRSFDDLLELTQTYFPETTEQDLMKVLLEIKIPLKGEGKFSKPHLGTCNGMGKIRYVPYHIHAYDEINTRMVNSKWTWNELLAPLGINNLNDFEAYLVKHR